MEEQVSRRDRILMGIYSSTWKTSFLALLVVMALEVFMLTYTVVDPPLFGDRVWKYRACYIALLLLAGLYLLLNRYVRRDKARRFRLLNAANPVCTVLFYIWALYITYSDIQKGSPVDPTVFMTFSLLTMLSFYLTPAAFVGINLVVDAVMLYTAFSVSGGEGLIINLTIFCIFQFVLGLSFLRMKWQLTERIVIEEDNAQKDIMTGFFNRRAYEEDTEALRKSTDWTKLNLLSIDLNGLKQVNDSAGHEAGDRLIAGAAECMEKSFRSAGRLYRVGGDEFVALVFAEPDELEGMLEEYEACMKVWSAKNGLELSTSYGCVSTREMPNASLPELTEEADKRMYAAKERYYQRTGKERRKR